MLSICLGLLAVLAGLAGRILILLATIAGISPDCWPAGPDGLTCSLDLLAPWLSWLGHKSDSEGNSVQCLFNCASTADRSLGTQIVLGSQIALRSQIALESRITF